MLATLRKKRADIVAKMGVLNTLAINENRDFTAEEQSQYDGFNAEQEGLKSQITRLEIQQQLDAEMNGAVTKPVAFGVPAVVSMKDNQILDETGFSDFGDFMGAVKSGTDKRLSSLYAEQTMGNGSEGGFLIPTQFGQLLKTFNPEDSIVRQRATVIPSGNYPDGEITFPALDQSGSKGVYSGVVTQWVAEGKEIPETAFSLREIKLISKAVAGLMPFSNKLLRNTESASALGIKLLRQAIAKAEDDAFIVGDGVGKPLGYLNSTSSKVVNRGTLGAVSFNDLVAMVANSFGDNLEWVISRTLYTDIVTMTKPNDDYLFTVGINGAPDRILGFPIRWSQRTPTKGNKGDVQLLDLSYYYIKDGSRLMLSASEHVLFKQDKTLFKIVANVDGQSSLNDKLTLENGSTVSPFVILN
ncbi:phage major capsid protein [Aliarcobacter lanthieri]|uniref:phage major capsid protein n=1 Tax=Aliarcobacter lanthieri TaxID=1355374 RepID=UPI003AAF4E0E